MQGIITMFVVFFVILELFLAFALTVSVIKIIREARKNRKRADEAMRKLMSEFDIKDEDLKPKK